MCGSKSFNSPQFSGRRGCAHAPPQVVLHGFRPTVSIWLISFHIYIMIIGSPSPYAGKPQAFTHSLKLSMFLII